MDLNVILSALDGAGLYTSIKPEKDSVKLQCLIRGETHFSLRQDEDLQLT